MRAARRRRARKGSAFVSDNERATGELAEVVEREMARWTVPGLAVGILRDGRATTHGWGVTSLEMAYPVRPATLFQIGSISKVFTATLVMQLVDEGKLDLDAPIATYLPDLLLEDMAAARAITLRQLLSHSGGMDGDRFDDFGHGDDALTRAVADYRTLPQLTPPGELWSYCNSGFNLAGAVIERVTGQVFEAAMRERVFAPLALEHACFFAHEAIVHSAAVGHTHDPEAAEDAAPTIARHYPLPRCVNPAGGIITTAGDLLRFAACHLEDGAAGDERVLSPESTRAMREPQIAGANFAEHYGIGWALRTVGGARIAGHGGSTNGFQAQLTLVPDQGFAIAVLTNSGRGSAAARGIIDWALDRYCGLRAADPAPATLSPDELARYAGRYERRVASLDVAVADGGLRVTGTSTTLLADERKEVPIPPLTLRPIGANRFVVTAGESRSSAIDFVGERDGKPRFIRVGGRIHERATG